MRYIHFLQKRVSFVANDENMKTRSISFILSFFFSFLHKKTSRKCGFKRTRVKVPVQTKARKQETKKKNAKLL